jgi:hypothetical protein
MQRVLNTLRDDGLLIACADGICVRATEGRDADEGDSDAGGPLNVFAEPVELLWISGLRVWDAERAAIMCFGDRLKT